jgi:CBS domain containing-hemolysin-like protein
LLGFRLSGDDTFSTLAGYVLQQLGRLPSAGDTFTSEGLHFEVVAMDGARIGRLKVTPEE